jgi:hypothetical protein
MESETTFDQQLIREGLVAAIKRFWLRMLLIFIFAAVQGFRFGFLERDYLLLIFGSVLSAICGLAYGTVGLERANARPEHFWMLLAIWSGSLPYFFTLYLIGYRGLWQLVNVFRDFSTLALVSAIGFTVIGWTAIRHLQAITDFTLSARQFQQVS